MTREPAEVGHKRQVFLVPIDERPRHYGNVQYLDTAGLPFTATTQLKLSIQTLTIEML